MEMTTYTVYRNRDGGNFDERSGLTERAAIDHAAELARVTPRTIRRRMRDGVFSGGCMQVGGREIGDDGVWIEMEG